MARVIKQGITIPGIVLTAVLLLIGSSANAGQATKYSWYFFSTAYLEGLADFLIQVDSVVSVEEVDVFDKSGGLRVSQHLVEQDTFTANGKTLVSEPFTFNIQLDFDSSGNLTRFTSEGPGAKVRLPDGGLFVTAGFIDWLTHPPGTTYILAPDKGSCVNLEGFIKALSP